MARLIKKSKLLGQPETLLYDREHKRNEVKITIFDYDENTCREKSAATIEECVLFRDKTSVTWINVDGLHDVELLEKLNSCYRIHHLVMEDILNVNQRPKIEDFGEYIYIVARMLSLDVKKREITEEQVSVLLGNNFVITFQEEKRGDVFEPIRDRIRNNKGRIRKMGADYLVYALLDAIVDNYFIILEQFGEHIEILEEKLVSRPGQQVLSEIHALKRNLIFLRRSVWPLREIINIIVKSESPLIKESSNLYYRDVYDHAIQAMDTVEAYRDMSSGMLDIYLSSISNRLNEIMKVLTIIATIFMPLTFLAGIYGMNFNTHSSPFNMPELNWPYGYFFVLGIMASVGFGMLAYFKRKKWF